MAITGTDTSTLDSLLKRFYTRQAIVDQQQFDPDFIETLPQAPEKPGGVAASVYIGVRLQRRQDGGAQLQAEQFRSNESGKYGQAVVSCKINIWPVELTNFLIEAGKGNEYAFMSSLDSEMSDARRAGLKDGNRQAFGDGSGVLAYVNGTIAASTALVVDTPGVQYFYPGMRIDVYTSAGVAEALNVQISSVTESSLTLTMASAISVTDNSYILKAGVYNTADVNVTQKEMMGLSGIGDDSTPATFEGIARGTYDIWKGTVVDASSASLTTDLLQRTADKVERRSGQNVTRFVSHRNQRRAYLNLTVPKKRFMSDKMDDGFQVLEWNGFKWLVSHDCQKDTIYMYNEKSVEVFSMHPFDLDQSDGKILKHIPRTDTVEAYYKRYENLGSRQPSAVGKLKSLATLTDY